MALPTALTEFSFGDQSEPSYATGTLAASYTAGQTFTVASAASWLETNSTGQITANPLGTSGPFVVAYDFSESSEEHILCSSVNLSTGVVTVWSDGTYNGRQYGASNSISGGVSHAVGAADQPNIFPIQSAVVDGQNRAQIILNAANIATNTTNIATNATAISTETTNRTNADTTLQTNINAKANDSAVVHNTGAENVAGVKTFSSAPVVPSNSFPESAVTNLTTDLSLKAPLASPALTGTPTAPTQAAGDNTTKIATDQFVTTAVAGAVNVATDTFNVVQYGATPLTAKQARANLVAWSSPAVATGDSSAAFQSAYAAAKTYRAANLAPAKIYIPAGDYIIDPNVAKWWTETNDLFIECEDIGATRIWVYDHASTFGSWSFTTSFNGSTQTIYPLAFIHVHITDPAWWGGYYAGFSNQSLAQIPPIRPGMIDLTFAPAGLTGIDYGPGVYARIKASVSNGTGFAPASLAHVAQDTPSRGIRIRTGPTAPLTSLGTVTSILNSGTPYTSVVVSGASVALLDGYQITIQSTAGYSVSARVNGNQTLTGAGTITVQSFTPSQTFNTSSTVGYGVINNGWTEDTILEEGTTLNGCQVGLDVESESVESMQGTKWDRIYIRPLKAGQIGIRTGMGAAYAITSASITTDRLGNAAIKWILPSAVTIPDGNNIVVVGTNNSTFNGTFFVGANQGSNPNNTDAGLVLYTTVGAASGSATGGTFSARNLLYQSYLEAELALATPSTTLGTLTGATLVAGGGATLPLTSATGQINAITLAVTATTTIYNGMPIYLKTASNGGCVVFARGNAAGGVALSGSGSATISIVPFTVQDGSTSIATATPVLLPVVGWQHGVDVLDSSFVRGSEIILTGEDSGNGAIGFTLGKAAYWEARARIELTEYGAIKNQINSFNQTSLLPFVNANETNAGGTQLSNPASVYYPFDGPNKIVGDLEMMSTGRIGAQALVVTNTVYPAGSFHSATLSVSGNAQTSGTTVDITGSGTSGTADALTANVPTASSGLIFRGQKNRATVFSVDGVGNVVAHKIQAGGTGEYLGDYVGAIHGANLPDATYALGDFHTDIAHNDIWYCTTAGTKNGTCVFTSLRAQILTNTLDQFANPVAAIVMNGQKLTGLSVNSGANSGEALASRNAGVDTGVLIYKTGTGPQWKALTGDMTVDDNGVTFVATVNGAAVVPASRNVNTSAPLTGGGNLTSDLSLGFSPSADVAWNSHKITGLLAGTAATDGMNYSQLTAQRPAHVLNQWYPIGNGFTGTYAPPTINRPLANPLIVPQLHTYQSLGFRVNANVNGTVARAAICIDNGGVPGSLVWESNAQITLTAASQITYALSSGVYQSPYSAALAPMMYWLIWVPQVSITAYTGYGKTGANPLPDDYWMGQSSQFGGNNNTSLVGSADVTGAYPTNYAGTWAVTNQVPQVAIKA